jgi:hypothetical protein
VYKDPVISLDIHPTAVAAAGGPISPEWKLDGVDLLPFLTGQAKGKPHDTLCWRMGLQHAIRQGDWKLVGALMDENQELLAARAELSQPNTTLEEKVQDRTSNPMAETANRKVVEDRGMPARDFGQSTFAPWDSSRRSSVSFSIFTPARSSSARPASWTAAIFASSRTRKSPRIGRLRIRRDAQETRFLKKAGFLV